MRPPYFFGGDQAARRAHVFLLAKPMLRTSENAIAGGSRRPVADTAKALGEPRIAYIRDLLNVARQRDLLTRPEKGRAGGTLTQKALDALRGH